MSDKPNFETEPPKVAAPVLLATALRQVIAEMTSKYKAHDWTAMDVVGALECVKYEILVGSFQRPVTARPPVVQPAQGPSGSVEPTGLN